MLVARSNALVAYALRQASGGGGAPSIPWVVFVAFCSAGVGVLSSYYGLKYRIKRQEENSMHEIAQLREDMDRKHAENKAVTERMTQAHDRMEDRGRFTLRLVAEVARKMKVDGVDEQVIDHFTRPQPAPDRDD